MAECTSFSSYLLDVYLFLLFFVIALFGSFLCCCMAKCSAENSSTLPTSKVEGERPPHPTDGSKSPNPCVSYFCGDELLCCSKDPVSNRKCGKQLAVAVVLRIFLAAVVAFLAMIVLLAILLAALQNSLMYPAELATDCTVCAGDLATITFNDSSSVDANRSPYCCDYDPAPYLVVAAEGMLSTTEGDSINWWFIEGNSSGFSRPLTLVYSHGSGRLLASPYRLQRYQYLASIGVNVVAYDYAGYGRSTSADATLSEETAVRSAKAIVTMVTDGASLPVAGVNSSSELLALGRSMGTGVTLRMVADGQEFLGVMLQSPFSSYQAAVAAVVATPLGQWLVEAVIGNVFDNVRNIEDLVRPLYASATLNDDFVPFAQSEEVYNAAVNVPENDRQFVEYSCYAHDDDLSPAEKQALLAWVNRFR